MTYETRNAPNSGCSQEIGYCFFLSDAYAVRAKLAVLQSSEHREANGNAEDRESSAMEGMVQAIRDQSCVKVVAQSSMSCSTLKASKNIKHHLMLPPALNLTEAQATAQ